jgi:ferric-dicitrate binding protein FerR (iron transport regulator)
MTVLQVDTDYFTSWIDGKLVFRNAPLELVAKKLERWYNCSIHIEDTGIRESRYTGNIEMESLNEVLELIKLTTPIKSRFNSDTREIWIEPL